MALYNKLASTVTINVI